MSRLNSTQEFIVQLQDQLTALSTRISNLESMHPATIKYVHGTSYIINTTINNGVTYTTGDLRGTNGIATNAAGVFLFTWSNFAMGGGVTCSLQCGPSGETLDVYSTKFYLESPDHDEGSAFMMIKLGTDGKLQMKAVGANIPVLSVLVGYYI